MNEMERPLILGTVMEAGNRVDWLKGAVMKEVVLTGTGSPRTWLSGRTISINY